MEWKFQSVDPGSLKSALSQCRKGIDHGITDSLATGMSDSVWQSSSKTKLQNILSTMGGEAYKSLEGAIDQYIGVAGLIEQYKNLETEYKSLEAEYSSLKPKLMITVKKIESHRDEVTLKWVSKTVEYQTVNQTVKKRMDWIVARKKEIETEAVSLEKQIVSSV